MAGDIFVVGSGVFLYWSIAFWNVSTSRELSFLTLLVINLFDCFDTYFGPAVAVWECHRT